ncbi:uncharacterized protein LOC106012613 [Aplysia californica]|uniref:Uncharacterized protein LOC106012613 n=1 Tax=Aplysia californica TaxID=6500 RepID=A0ABM1A615_APLCA|nr:uncharacterized protein LOC106012613 [Aplysia californica]
MAACVTWFWGWLVGVCVAGAVLGQTPCCWSDKWEANLSQKLGVYNRVSNFASLAQIEGTMSVDHSLQKTYNDIRVTNGSSSTYLKVLDDFANGKSYTVYNGYCIKVNLTTPMPASCVPAKARLLGNHSFSGVQAQTWVVPAPAYPVTSDYNSSRITVSEKGCVPLHEVALQFADTSRMSVLSLQNLTPGIVDPSVFDIPLSCNTSRTYHSLRDVTDSSPHMHVVGQYLHRHKTHLL